MSTAYLIPDTPGATMKPGAKDVKMVPINRMVPRSFVTNLQNDANIRVGVRAEVRGIALGGDAGLKEVAFSADSGTSWQSATLGKDHGRYSFRQWHTSFVPRSAGIRTLMVKATNTNDVTQPTTSGWNPSGFMRNIIEQITVRAA
jgi:hypothetical protein